MTVRLKDIAQSLGISPMAVSKALRNHKDIGEATKKRVLQRAAELNYRVDWVARSMVTGRTFLVGLVVPDLMQSFFAEIATAIARSLSPLGYHIVISHTGEDEKLEAENLGLLASRKVDGLVIASAQGANAAKVLRRLKTPYVLIDRLLTGVNANFVGTKNEEIGLIATEHLIEQGYRRIAHIRGPALSTAVGRLRGYGRALAKHGLERRAEFVADGGHEDTDGYTAMRRLLALKPRPDAVFCFNDPVAVGALRAILEAGLSVPGDIALIGVANMHNSDVLRVPLSTVDQNTAAIGERAAELLLACMTARRRPQPRQILIEPKIIVRESSNRSG